jgi:hypothetical protein
VPRKSRLEARAYNRAYHRTVARLAKLHQTEFNAIMAQELEKARSEVFELGEFYRKPGPRKKSDRFEPQGTALPKSSSGTEPPVTSASHVRTAILSNV